MRAVATHQISEPDYYELALTLAHGQAGRLNENWPEFIDNLSRICDGFAHTRLQYAPVGGDSEPMEAAD